MLQCDVKDVETVVVGAGQAGLSAGYFLRRRGLVADAGFVVLDADDGPGGAWRHRWPALTLGRTHHINDLPDFPLGTPDSDEPASAVVARYYGQFERRFQLPVLRPVRVRAVTSPDGPSGRLLVETNRGTWRSRTLINATGTWDRPHWPAYPGRDTFRGRQLHTRDFTSVEDFHGQHVIVVGGRASAVQFLMAFDGVATTTWVTRRPPVFAERQPGTQWGRDVERRVEDRVRRGLPPTSVVAATGLVLSPDYQRGIESGILESRGMFSEIVPEGVRFADGTVIRADVILWATGFRAALDHLAPLHLREHGGGITMDGTTVVRDPRIQLVGYGPSASTLGATRAGRRAARAVLSAAA